MAKLVCEVCGFTKEAPEGGEMVEQSSHCGQTMKVED